MARRLGRRAFLASGAAVLGGAAALGGRELLDADPEPAAPDSPGRATVAFHGEHQAGVVTPGQAFASFVALDLVDGVDREALVRLMRVWTDDIERLTRGAPGLTDTEPELAAVPAGLTVTVGYGPGVLTAAGREDLRPGWLTPLPAFGVDRLQEAWSGGDLLLQICADDEITVAHAVRVLVKEARTFATVRWVQRGFRNSPGTVTPGTTMRNLMGQVDGTSNPIPGTEDDRLIWIGPEGPAWLHGGTGMVVRRIAMNLDTWDELDRPAREQVIGRRLDNGAPLTGTHEHEEPDLEAMTELKLPVIESFAHIRRARSDDPDHRFLRRSYNYDESPPAGELSNSGLVFVSFQADIDAQFTPIQRRLDQLDLLNQWTTPIGSAVFAVPGGCRPGEYLGQRLLEP
ncbi:Dyp-type peroxidase [Pseudonocardia asaccharolytica]|uniref:Peroxidase n=1 Tax=Pseudonocardia asaccharolytica DSM 44247 = NBRC 16224 TaxID=1123024 RepID=A0A511D7J7_9PSEU|nr:Dyp-type peroxidase [Pseudonocardia asaccharolytica]GEL19604.1 peroxidase [Pseudonocardia asaccharolytica DSM 44247 = NBRC 16224]